MKKGMKAAAVEDMSMGGPKSSASASASPPPPPPPPARRSGTNSSVTGREIDKFWRKKRLVEEEHFVAAIKAAARLRASRLSEEEYLLFLDDIQEQEQEEKASNICKESKQSATNTPQEIRVGIKDWWTKSKYAYLNQPAVGSTTGKSGRASRRSNYTPNPFYFCNYKYSPVSGTTTPSATLMPPTVSAQVQSQSQPQAPPPYLGVF